MQDKVNPFASAPTGGHLSNVTFEESKSTPLVWLYAPFDLFEVPQVTGAKVVNAFDDLFMLQESFEQRRTNEAGDPGY